MPPGRADCSACTRDAVAILRASAGANPYDKALSDVVGELSTRSDEFRTRWAAHNVKFHHTGTKPLHPLIVGDLDLDVESLDLPADPGLRVTTYTAAAGIASADGLTLLAGWAATPEAVDDTSDLHSTTH